MKTACLLAAALAASPAAAQMTQIGKFGVWTVSTIGDDRGQICAMSTEWGGVSVGLASEGGAAPDLVVSSPRWSLAPRTVPVSFAIDGDRFDAMVDLSGRSMVFNHVYPEMLDAMPKASLLAISSGEGLPLAAVTLNGSAPAFEAFRDCRVRITDPADPFGEGTIIIEDDEAPADMGSL